MKPDLLLEAVRQFCQTGIDTLEDSDGDDTQRGYKNAMLEVIRLCNTLAPFTKEEAT